MHVASMVVYGVRDLALPEQMRRLGYRVGAVPLLQKVQRLNLGDERSDRTRTLWPHVFDVVHDHEHRWHATAPRLKEWPQEPFGLEIIRFISPSDAKALSTLKGGSRREVTIGLAIFFVESTAAELAELQSRARQDLHHAVDDALGNVGTVGFDRATEDDLDQMHASELPFVLTAAVADAQPDLGAVAGRSLVGCEVLEVVGWRVAVWQDLIVMVSAEGGSADYWPLHHAPEVALAGVGDAVLMRVLQRYALHMLATRVVEAAPGTALDLQAAAHPIRSRLWWNGLSGDPLVSDVADALARRWDLDELAEETFTGLEVLARRDALNASERLNTILFYFAAVTIALAIVLIGAGASAFRSSSR
jgi:hypothetical protein